MHDKFGKTLEPTDLVRVGKIPEYVYKNHIGSDGPESSIPGYIKGFEGSYGYVSYFLGERYLDDDIERPGWIREAPKNDWEIYIETVQIDQSHLLGKPCVSYAGFWVSCQELERLPYNIVIASLFGGHPWTISDCTTTPIDQPFVVEGTNKFEFTKNVFDAPYERLCQMHAAAMNYLTDD